MNATDIHRHKHPERADAVVFFIKSNLLKARRGVIDLLDPAARPRSKSNAKTGAILAQVTTALYTETDPNERALQLGKVQNLRVGARALDGVKLAPEEVLSFWAHVGRPTRAKGFVEGRELRQGCLIPTLAGGLCQLSNSLFQVAKGAGCIIVERHGHSAPIPNSPFPPGEDATVFWNYIDLRFRAQQAMILRVRLDAESLIVALEAA